MTPVEVEFIMALPASNRDLAAKFNQKEKAVEGKIDDLMRRGLIHPSPKGPVFWDILLLRDEMLTSDPALVTLKMVRLWRQYYEEVLVDEFKDMLLSIKPPLFRVIPLRKAVPKDVELLPYEDICAILNTSKKVAIRECVCRIHQQKCNMPLHSCIQFNDRADYAIKRGAAENIPLEKVFEIESQLEDAGLVPMVANIASMDAPGYVCMCCGCCCAAIDPLKRHNLLRHEEGLARSRFVALVGIDKCTSCGKCVKRCQFGAIKMVKVEGEKKRNAFVDPELCYGCGACVLACEQEALRLKMVRPPDHIPKEHPVLIP